MRAPFMFRPILLAFLLAGTALAQTAPTLVNDAPTSTNATTAELAGTVTSTGGAPTTVLTYWGESDGGTVSTNWDFVITNGVLGEVAFSTNVSGLLYGIQYYYRCYATNSAGEGWAPSTTNFVTASPATGQLTDELGILDLDAGGGINPATGRKWEPGDTYRLIFVTSQITNAVSVDINDYNAFVQSVADASSYGIGAAEGATWKVLGSTATVDARDNTETHMAVYGDGQAMYSVNGTTLIFSNHFDLWDGHSPAKPFRTEEMGAPPNMKTYGDTWTGIFRNAYPNADYGTGEAGGQVLGNLSGNTMCGLPGGTQTQWIWRWGNVKTDNLPMYALSMPLDINGNFMIFNHYASKLAFTNASIDGRLVATGAVCEVSVYWSTNNNADAAAWLADSSALSTYVGSYTNADLTVTQAIDSLTSGTTYYFAYVASNFVTNIWASPNGVFTALDSYYWDGGTVDILTDGNAVSDGGAGTWNSSTVNWDIGYAPHSAWPNTTNSKAVLGGTAGTVTLGETINLKQLYVNGADGYVISGNPLVFGTGGTVTNLSTLSISSDITGYPSFDIRDHLTLTAAAQTIGSVNQPAGNGPWLYLRGSGLGTIETIGNGDNNKINKNNSGTWRVGTIRSGREITVDGGILIITNRIEPTRNDLTRALEVNAGEFHFNSPDTFVDSVGASFRFWMDGGSIDNSSGAPLSVGTGTLDEQWRGNFTFIGSLGANSDLEIAMGGTTTLTGNRTVTIQNALTTLTCPRPIVDGGSAYSLTKAGAGTLKLTGTNTFTGDMHVNAGTLWLDNSQTIADTNTLHIASGAKVYLGTGVTETVTYLYLDGTMQFGHEWTSASTPAYFSGPGMLNVLLPDLPGSIIIIH